MKKRIRNKGKRIIAGILLLVVICLFTETTVQAFAPEELTSPSVVLMEAGTGTVIWERDADTRRSPASITKIMTLYLIFEELQQGNIALTDEVVTSEYAMSMGGSQVFLEAGEIQTVDTLIKCIAVASGNDASVAMAEYISGSEEAFVERMNQTAVNLGLQNTHFKDCCGLSDSPEHYMSAYDVAYLTRELITKYPEIYNYSTIWMEDIVHNTARGSEIFTLSSTNKLLQEYEYATGLKTGSTSAAKYCLSATASKEGMDLIAVVMAAPDFRVRFTEAELLLEYGYAICDLYRDENVEPLPAQPVERGVREEANVAYKTPFCYLSTDGSDVSLINKEIQISDNITAPMAKGEVVGRAVYYLNGEEIGSVDIILMDDLEAAQPLDYFKKFFGKYLL